MTGELVKVSARFHEQGSVLRGDAEGFADGFEIEISLASSEAAEEIRELIRISRAMCFTEKALAGIEVNVTARVNGEMVGL